MKGALLVCDPDGEYLKKLQTSAAGNASRPLVIAQYGREAMKMLANRADSFAAIVIHLRTDRPDASSVASFSRHVRPSVPIFVFDEPDRQEEIEALLKRGVRQAVKRDVSYAELVELVHARTGWSADEFSGVRFLIEYPPFPSTVIVSFPLESK